MNAAMVNSINEVVADIAHTSTLLVALDFDGTLAPTVDVPDDARALPAAHAAVLRLIGTTSTPVAIVSGRGLASLKRVCELPSEAILVGSHGVEFDLDGMEQIPELSESELKRRELLGAALYRIARRFPSLLIEEKRAGYALHSRLATPSDAAVAEAEALSLAAVDGVTWRRGKNVIEFSVRFADKGSALSRLRVHTGASGILFIGDDVTDEDAFAALEPGDVGVKVGGGETTAGYRVADPAAVAELLTRLADDREKWTQSYMLET